MTRALRQIHTTCCILLAGTLTSCASAAARPVSQRAEGRDALRTTVAVEQGPFVESLQFSFPVASADSATLALQWGTTLLRFPLHPAQQESCVTSFVNVCAASFNPSTIVRYGKS